MASDARHAAGAQARMQNDAVGAGGVLVASALLLVLGRWRRARLLLQRLEPLLQIGQACHQRAIGSVLDGFLLHFRPARVGVLLIPRLVGLRIEDMLKSQIVQGPVIFVEIENAIARLEIEICAIQLAAMPQPAGESFLRHAGIEDFALEIVDGGILRPRRHGKTGPKQGQRTDAASSNTHNYPRHDLIPQ